MNNLQKFQELKCKITHNNQQVLLEADLILLCVKPMKVGDVLENTKKQFAVRHLLISVVSGLKIQSIYDSFGVPKFVTIIRVMPNLPVVVCSGVFAYSCSQATDNESKEVTKYLFSSLGICEEVDEHLIDVVCGLSGSGPAYIFTVIQAMSDGAVKMGLPRHLATKMAAQTVKGAAEMVLKTGKHPGVLKDEVCSPAGTTIRAIHVLERAGVRSAFMDAVEVATERAREQGKTMPF